MGVGNMGKSMGFCRYGASRQLSRRRTASRCGGLGELATGLEPVPCGTRRSPERRIVTLASTSPSRWDQDAAAAARAASRRRAKAKKTSYVVPARGGLLLECLDACAQVVRGFKQARRKPRYAYVEGLVLVILVIIYVDRAASASRAVIGPLGSSQPCIHLLSLRATQPARHTKPRRTRRWA